LWTKLPVKIFLAAMVFLVGFSGFAAYDIWTYAETTELVKADAAIVLGTAVWGEEPSPVLRERINHSIWLYERDYVEMIIFTGGKTNGSQLAEAVVSKNYAIAQGIPEEDILIEFSDFLVVSDPLHMKRALQMAEDTGFVAYSSPTTSSEYNTLATIIPFFFREIGAYVAYTLSFAR